MKSETRKSSAHGRSATHAAATETKVADAEYASQLLAAAEALGPDSATMEKADDTSPVIVLPVQCAMRDMADLRVQLMKCIDLDEAVQIDATRVERIDAAAMQVLLAFVMDRAKQQRNVEWCGVNAVLKEAAQVLGLDALLRMPMLEQAA